MFLFICAGCCHQPTSAKAYVCEMLGRDHTYVYIYIYVYMYALLAPNKDIVTPVAGVFGGGYVLRSHYSYKRTVLFFTCYYGRHIGIPATAVVVVVKYANDYVCWCCFWALTNLSEIS